MSWFESSDGGETGKLRVSTINGRSRTHVDWDLDNGELANGLLSGRWLYWTEEGRDPDSSSLLRAPITGNAACQVLEPEDYFVDPWNYGARQIAVDRRRVLYLDPGGVFAVSPTKLRWRQCG